MKLHLDILPLAIKPLLKRILFLEEKQQAYDDGASNFPVHFYSPTQSHALKDFPSQLETTAMSHILIQSTSIEANIPQYTNIYVDNFKTPSPSNHSYNNLSTCDQIKATTSLFMYCLM